MPTVSETLAQAKAYHSAGQLRAAEQFSLKVLEADAGNAEAFYLLGVVYCGLGRLKEALASLEKSVRLQPRHLKAGYADAFRKLATALANQNRLDEAEVCYRQVLELKPDDPEAHYHLANMLAGQSKLDEAIVCYRQVLKLEPGHADACYNLAVVLMRQDKLDESVSCYRQVLQLEPKRTEALNNLAATLANLGKLDEAMACYRQALALRPDYAGAHYNRGQVLLLTGRFAEGWPEFEWLWKLTGNEQPGLRRPRWTGTALAGKTILLDSAVGFGDALQFIRYAELVKRQGCTVIVECHPHLEHLFATCAGVDRVFVPGQSLPKFDAYAPLLSLPGIFCTTLATMPTRVPYLSPDAGLVEQWKHELSAERAFKVGIAWQGNPAHLKDNLRSIPLAQFAGIARTPGVRVYSLQMGVGREQLAELGEPSPIIDLGDRPGDLHITAAIMRNLDLVITCDSAPAHLAGALGVPVWVALPFSPDWRWMLERADSPWYPTMRLFRQSRRGDWDGVFERIEEELSKQLQLQKLRPGRADALSKLAIAPLNQNRLNEAEACYRQVLEFKPDDPEACYNLANVLAGQNKLDEAIVCYHHVLNRQPGHADACYNLAVALMKQDKLDESIAYYRQVLTLEPNRTEALNNLAAMLANQSKLDEAVVCYRQAVALRPDFAEAYNNLANALVEQNKLAEALDCNRQALELKPDCADTRTNRGQILLMLGRLAEGWPEYEWRWESTAHKEPALPYPRWTGSPLSGRTILLRFEQGFGDTLQFIRYAELVKRQGCTVIVECQPRLERLLASCAGVDRALVTGQSLPKFDVYAPLLSLPGIFRTSLGSIPAKVPYLWPDADSVEQWKRELGAERAFKIGIAWQGNPAFLKDRFRSIPLAHFAGIIRMRGVRVYSLQMGVGCEQLNECTGRWPITNLGDRLGDFHNTAAIMRNLDLVITSDSASAHLAGALGVPVWVALTFAPEWRWMLEREDSPWYPTMRLFRQGRPGDWKGVFQSIENELAKIA